MAYNVLILGASYGSLLGTKLLMAGHNVTLVCRAKTAELINTAGTEVRIKLRGEDGHRSVFSKQQPGTLKACTPSDVQVSDYDLVALAMQEPQYTVPEIRALMAGIAAAKLPCLSIMNMPPLPYLKRIAGIDIGQLADAYTDTGVWDAFEPGLMTLCSPDPQAFRPPEEAANVLHVGLPTNFKAASFADAAQTELLHRLATDIDAVRLDGADVPVKLRVHDSVFVPLAKWAMLLAGNYRCVTADGARPIAEAVHGTFETSSSVYKFVNTLTEALGADPADHVPFEKYAKAAQSLTKPSSAARAITAGAEKIERVDRLVQLIGRQKKMAHTEIEAVVRTVDARLEQNNSATNIDAAAINS